MSKVQMDERGRGNLSVMPGANSAVKRLLGWKAIGQFLGCTERTARRWEADRAMPVHRVPGRSRSSVWASPDELTQWLNSLPVAIQADIRSEAQADEQADDHHAASDSSPSQGAASPLDTVPPPPASPARVPELVLQPVPAPSLLSPRSRRLWMVALCSVLVLGGTSLWRRTHVLSSVATGAGVAVTAYDDDPPAREEYRTAQFELATRSAASIAAASAAFRHLTERYPARAAGWSGLADTYLLAREFGSTSDADAYAGAEDAARTAIRLDPKSADAWLEMGFVNFWSNGNVEVGLKAFQTGLQLNPASARGWLWYGNALSATRRFDEALQALARARALDPESRAIIADESWAQFLAGQREVALATMERLVRINPDFVSWHAYLQRCYLVLGRDKDFLREALATAELRGQADAAAQMAVVAQRYESGGRAAMLDQLTRDAVDAWRNGRGSAVTIARYRAQAKDRAGMIQWLAVAAAQHDYFVGVIADPEFNDYWNDPAVSQLAALKN